MEAEKKKEPWFGSTWAEFFIAFIFARLIQYTWLPDTGMVILLPIVWLIIHLVLGKWIKEKATKDLFKKKV